MPNYQYPDLEHDEVERVAYAAVLIVTCMGSTTREHCFPRQVHGLLSACGKRLGIDPFDVVLCYTLIAVVPLREVLKTYRYDFIRHKYPTEHWQKDGNELKTQHLGVAKISSNLG